MKLLSNHAFTDHALRRLRERWPDCAHLPVRILQDQVLRQMHQATREHGTVLTPGGEYYPISFFGRDGYAVLRGGLITTFLPEEWCPEVNAVRAQTPAA